MTFKFYLPIWLQSNNNENPKNFEIGYLELAPIDDAPTTSVKIEGGIDR